MILNIAKICDSRQQTISFLRDKGLIVKSRACQICCKEMKQTSKKQLSDGIVWQCSKGCQTQSIRKDSIFEATKLPLEISLLTLYMYCCDTPAYLAHRLIGQDNIDYNSILKWYDMFRKLCSTVLINNPLVFDESVFIGSEKCEIEIDECYLGKKAKNDKGTSKQDNLVFGIVEKAGKKCVLYLVESASRDQLLPLIEKHVPKTTTIFHDGLATYSKLHELGYKHEVVYHNREFVTKEGVHTNTIEGLWGNFRQRIAMMHGMKNSSRLSAHMDEFSFRQNYKDKNGSIWDVWIEFSKQYSDWWKD